MEPQQIGINGLFSSRIAKHTAENSHFDTSRDYISLSQIVLKEEDLIGQSKNGWEDSMDNRLRCYKGYQMEKDLLVRIATVFGERVKTPVEIIAFGGLAKGHPDFTFDEYPADCKSVLMDEWLPKDHILPKRIYWQMQAYMKYSGKDRALTIFESRESGKLVDIWVRPNLTIQAAIDLKITNVIKALNNGGK